MKENKSAFISSIDPVGMMTSLSGVVLGVLLAVADYRVEYGVAVSVVAASALLHMYMSSGSRYFLAASLAGAFLVTWLSFGTVLKLEPILLLLFSYFVIRLGKGIRDSGRVIEAVVNCLLYGPVALFGAYFVCSHSFGFGLLMIPALSVGLLSVAVAGLKDGYGRNITAILVAAALVLMTVFSFMRIFNPSHYLYLLTVPAFAYIIIRMYTKKEQDPVSCRSALSLSVFAMAVLAGIGFVAYLF